MFTAHGIINVQSLNETAVSRMLFYSSFIVTNRNSIRRNIAKKNDDRAIALDSRKFQQSFTLRRFILCTIYPLIFHRLCTGPFFNPFYSQRSAGLELKVVLRMIESIRRQSMHRMRRRRCVETVMGVRLRSGELAVAVLFGRRH